MLTFSINGELSWSCVYTNRSIENGAQSYTKTTDFPFVYNLI